MGKHCKTEETNDELNIKRENNSKKMYNNKKVNKKEKKKKHKFLKIFLVILVLLGIFFAKRLYDADGNWLAALLGHDKNTLKDLEPLQVLILGESTGMSDTIIAASYNPQTQEAALLTIPRDTFTGENKSSAKYYHKINALYNYGKTPEKTVDAVNEITGLNLKNYIIVDTEALIKLVDEIGGLDYDVPIDMNYDDSEQDLHIHLSKGWQKLNGEQVEQLVRFRHNNDGSTYPYEYGIEDHGRSKTQRNVVVAIAKQTIQLKNISKISSIIDIFANGNYIDTNMNLNSVKDYIPYAVNMDMNNVKVGRLPGKDDTVNGIWFFFHDEEETEALVNELFLGIPSEEENSSISNEI